MTVKELTVSHDRRNGYMLNGRLGRNGYDWWWHSLIGVNKKTLEKKPFFIEYYIINPRLGQDQPVLGQLEEHKERGIRPSYAMIKVGSWGKGSSKQIHEFFPVKDFSASKEFMDVRISGFRPFLRSITEPALTAGITLGLLLTTTSSCLPTRAVLRI